MKLQVLAILICFMILQNSYSQTKYRNDFIEFSAGLSFPVGSFASTNPMDKFAGYAKVGESINFSFVHGIHKNLGLVAMLYAQRNGLNTAVLAKQFAETPIPIYYMGGGPNYYPNWAIDKKSWCLESILIGLNNEFKIKPNGKLKFTSRAAIGMAYAQLPKINASSKTDTSYATYNQNSADAFGVSYMASLGLKFDYNKRLRFLIGMSYFGTTQIAFKNVTDVFVATNGGLYVPKIYSFSNSIGPVEWLSSTYTNKQRLSSINISFGIEIGL